jgi:hypothetical protein
MAIFYYICEGFFFAPMVIGTSLHMWDFLHMHSLPNVKFLSHVINASQSVKIMHMHIDLHKNA